MMMVRLSNFLLNVISVLGIIFVFLSGGIAIPGADIWFAQFISFLSMVFISIAIYFLRFNWRYTFFLLVTWYSAIFEAQQHPRAMLCMFQILFGCMAIWFISKSKVEFKWFIRSIIALVVIQGLWTILQYFNIDPIFIKAGDPTLDSPVGFSASANQLALFFAVTLPIIVRYALVLLPLNIFGLWISATLTCSIAGIIGMAVYAIFSYSKRPFLILLCLILISGISLMVRRERISKFAIKERLDISILAIKSVLKEKVLVYEEENVQRVFTCNRWFGYGLGDYIWMGPRSQFDVLHLDPRNPGKFRAHVYNHVHNDFVEWFFETGIIGALSVLLIGLDLVNRFFKNIKSKECVIIFSSLLIFFISSLGIFTVHVATSGALLVLLLGLFYRLTNNNDEVDNGRITELGAGTA